MVAISGMYHIRDLFPSHNFQNTLMGIFAHPDDESLLLGGTLASAHAQGIRTMLITITKGELGGKFTGIFGKKLASIRSQELVCAASVLHIDTLIQMKVPDKGVSKAQRVVTESLFNHIHSNKPQIIVTHNPYDSREHPDHVATSRAVIDAVLKIESELQPKVFFATFNLTNTRPTTMLDIDGFSSIKIQACRAHASQGLFRNLRLPVEAYYALNHFEYFIPYEKEIPTDNKRHNSNQK